jgi:hypothetical protein
MSDSIPYNNKYYMMLSSEHSHIRREGAEHASDIRREGAEHASDIRREAAEHTSNIRREAAEHTSDLRREGAEHTNEIVKEALKSDFALRGDIKDSCLDVANRVGHSTDRIAAQLTAHDTRVADRFYSVGRDTQDIRAQIVAQQQQMVAGFATVAKDTEIASLKGILEGQKNTAYLSDKISTDGEKTRELVNKQNDEFLNRLLIERQTELYSCCKPPRCCHGYDGNNNNNQIATQLAVLQNQVQAFASQLTETRQGMVNFGTMAGVGQSSTSNNVR